MPSSAAASGVRTSSKAISRTRTSSGSRLSRPHEERLNEVGDEFGIEQRTRSFNELLDDDSIDIIDICTPPGIHLEQVLAALAAGKHVICEKPLTGSLEGVDAIMEAEKEARGVLMPIFQYRYGDGIEKAKRIIEAGSRASPMSARSRRSGCARPNIIPSPGAASGRRSSAACSSPTRCICTI